MKCVKSGHKELDADDDAMDVTMLDEEKMKSLLMDCIAALGVVRKMRIEKRKKLTLKVGGEPLTKETEIVRNDAFAVSLSLAATSLFHDAAKKPTQSDSVDRLLRAFPGVSNDDDDDDSRGWLPLHWAALALTTGEEKPVGLTETDMKVICTSDPLALQQFHQEGTDFDDMGFTPAQLLCTQAMTSSNMSLIRHFSICNQQAFTMSASYPNRGDPSLYGYSALHAACHLGQLTEELLKHLLQLDSSQTKKKCTSFGFTPLIYLCKNSSCSDRLVACLLEVDSSVEVVGNGLVGCLLSTDDAWEKGRVQMLLNANPEAAKYRYSNGTNLLHVATRYGKMPIHHCIDIMQRFVDIHKDAVQEVDSKGWLPVHTAAHYNTVEVMEFLLGLYPESASMVTTDKAHSLMHMAVADKECTTSVMEAKVRFLCSRYPAMVLQLDGEGYTPLQAAIWCKKIPAVQILCEAGGQELVKTPITHPTNANWKWNGWLPLHFLIYKQSDPLRDSLLSKGFDCFRMFLRWYPEAAGIEGGCGTKKKTPYQEAVDKNLPPYYLRLLLRAAPDLNPAELHRLNFAERRMAMFLAFRARTTNIDPPFLARLRFEKIDLVKHVISFL